MPRVYKRKSQRATHYTQEQPLEAIEQVKNRTLSMRRACSIYRIPLSTLADHTKGRRGAKSRKLGRDLDILFEDEQQIADSIRAMKKGGFGLTRLKLLEKVGEYVAKNKLKTRFKDGIPGLDWFIGFRKRHRLSIKKPQSILPEKFDPVVYRRWQDSRKVVHVTAEDEAEVEGETVGPPDKEPSPGPLGISAKNFQSDTNKVITLEQILAESMKLVDKSIETKKPKKGVSTGAEVITRNDVLLLLKEKEEAQKEKKGRKNKNNNESLASDSDEDTEQTIEYTEEDSGNLEDIRKEISKENLDLHEVMRSLSELSVENWVLAKFTGKRNIKYYVGKAVEINGEEEQIKFCRKSEFFRKKSIFKFPLVDDISTVSKTDIVKLLPDPDIGRRGEIYFQALFK